MEPLGRFLEYSMESLESILKAPLGQTLGQKPEGPQAEGLPEENPEGCPQSNPEGTEREL